MHGQPEVVAPAIKPGVVAILAAVCFSGIVTARLVARKRLAGERGDQAGESVSHVGAVDGKEERFTICTYNLRAFMDMYPRRKRLLRKTIQQVSPDILVLQEVMVRGADQDYFVLSCLNETCLAGSYKFFSHAAVLEHLRRHGAPKSTPPLLRPVFLGLIELTAALTNLPFVGRLIARLPIVMEKVRHWVHYVCGKDIFFFYYVLYAPVWGLSSMVHPHFEIMETAIIPLLTDVYDGHLAGALATRIRMPSGHQAWVINVHLDATTDKVGATYRAAEVQNILDWVKPRLSEVDVTIALGDYNVLLKEESVASMWQANGFASAHKTVHGFEPPVTWPSGMACSPFVDKDGDAGCLDYIWIHGIEKLHVHNAGVAGDTSCEHDPTLYPSDHLALFAELSFRR